MDEVGRQKWHKKRALMRDDQRRWHEMLGTYGSCLAVCAYVAHGSTISLEWFGTDVRGSWICIQE